MPEHDLTQTLASAEVQWTIAGLGALLLLLVLREVTKIPPQLRVLMATAFVDMVGVFFVVPLVPFYCKRFAEAGDGLFGHALAVGTTIGLVASVFNIAQATSAPLWGRFSDRFGRRPTLLIALAGAAVGFFVFGFADALWLLLLSRIVQGAGGGTVGVIQSYVADSVAPEQRARALGWLSSATNLGVALGPLFGTWAMQLGDVDLVPGDATWQLGSSAPGVAASLLCVLNMVFVWRCLPESHRAAPAQHGHPRSWPAVVDTVARPLQPVSRVLWIYAIAIGASQGSLPLMPMLLNGTVAVTEDEMGTVFAYVGVVSVYARMLLLGRMLDRFGEARVSRIGTVTLAAGLVLLPFADSLASLAVVMALVPLGTALLFPCVTALLSRVAPAEQRGLYLGLQQTYGSIARSVAPNAFGALFDHVARFSAFGAAAGCVLATLPLGIGLHRFSRRAATAPAPAAKT